MTRRNCAVLQGFVFVGVLAVTFISGSSRTREALSLRQLASIRGGSVMVSIREASCASISGFAGGCINAPDGGGCNQCSSSRTVMYLEMGGSPPPGYTYNTGVGPPAPCGNITVGSCQSQVCVGPFKVLQNSPCTTEPVIGSQPG